MCLKFNGKKLLRLQNMFVFKKIFSRTRIEFFVLYFYINIDFTWPQNFLKLIEKIDLAKHEINVVKWTTERTTKKIPLKTQLMCIRCQNCGKTNWLSYRTSKTYIYTQYFDFLLIFVWILLTKIYVYIYSEACECRLSSKRNEKKKRRRAREKCSEFICVAGWCARDQSIRIRLQLNIQSCTRQTNFQVNLSQMKCGWLNVLHFHFLYKMSEKVYFH